MATTAKTNKQILLDNAAKATGGKPVCDPNAPCQPCQRADLQLLVVVPSVLAMTYADGLSAAAHAFSPAFDSLFSQMRRKGSIPVARIMKQGFVYVYYPERHLWDVWQVAASGLTRKVMHQVDTEKYISLQPKFSGVQEPKSCSRGAANVPAQLISISGALSVKEAWLAYSSDPWTGPTLQRYADNPDIDTPGPGYSTVKRKLRDVRGRHIKPAAAASGALQPSCLPLNADALRHNVLDFSATAGAQLSEGCAAVLHPRDEARCGMAERFADEVRALERSLAQGLKNRDQYLNTTAILMVPDALGVAEAHTLINARTMAERQQWQAGGPDASGMNRNPDRPWQRQSMLQAGFIRDWVRASEQRRAERYIDVPSFPITPEDYKFAQSMQNTARPVYPADTKYTFNPALRLVNVFLSAEEKKRRMNTYAKDKAAKKIARYEKHLRLGEIERANGDWKAQEQGWIDLRKKNDQDYVDWLQTADFGAAVRYDFDDNRAVSKAVRTKEQLAVDVLEAKTRLRVMARCFGGAGCSEISIDYFTRQFHKEVTDPTHYIAQAMMGEFDFLPKLFAKVDEDRGAQADIYDAFLASKNSSDEFRDAWRTIGPPPASDISIIALATATITANLRSQALQPGMGGKNALAKTLGKAMQRSVLWVRTEALLKFIETNQKQYAFGVVWGQNAFAGAIDDTIPNPSTLGPGVISVDKRPKTMTGKQAKDMRKDVAKELRKQQSAVQARGLRNFESTSMILCSSEELAKIAAARGEKLIDIVSPGLFGLDRSVVRVPESWAREMTRRTHFNLRNLGSFAGLMNVGTLWFQYRAFEMSSGDIQTAGGYDQIDAYGSLLGASTALLGAGMEVGSMLLAPSALNKMGTPFAAELASRVPAHLWLKYGSGLCLGAGAIFDSSVALAKFFKSLDQGDEDAGIAYGVSVAAEFVSGLSLGAGALLAYRAARLDRLSQAAARQAVLRIFGTAFTPLALSRCLTGVGLLLWLGGLGFSFLAMYLEDDDNEVFLRRSYFGKGHPELGHFRDLDHEVASFGSLEIGTRAEMEWEDRIGADKVKVIVKVFKPEPTAVVTIRLDGYDKINGKMVRHLTAGKIGPLTPENDDEGNPSEIFVAEFSMELPDEVCAVKLAYHVYPNANKGTRQIATGDLWIND